MYHTSTSARLRHAVAGTMTFAAMLLSDTAFAPPADGAICEGCQPEQPPAPVPTDGAICVGCEPEPPPGPGPSDLAQFRLTVHSVTVWWPQDVGTFYNGDRDEVYLKIGGSKVWGYQTLGLDQTATVEVSRVFDVPLGSPVTWFEFWDDDDTSSDDKVTYQPIYASGPIGSHTLTVSQWGSGGEYAFTYSLQRIK